MALLKVLAYPDPFLKTHATEVTQFDDSLETLVQDMAETMYESIGVGLAATQIGSEHRLFVMDCHFNPDDDENQKKPIALINPKIIAREGESFMEEGCLSVPEFRAQVKRASKVTVEYQDVKGEKQSLTTEGLEAICIQHEMDHLEGVLFIDYLPPLKRKMVQTRLKKLDRLRL